MPTLYRKTAKGLAELETRSHRLPPRLRQLLILVDGRRGDDELRRLVAVQADESLHALASGGFIELVGVTSTLLTPQPLSPAAGGTAPNPAAAPAALTTPTRPAAPAYSEQLKRDAVRALTDQVGPVAEALALKIERARSADELRPLLEMARQSIRNTRGGAAAVVFGERFLGTVAV